MFINDLAVSINNQSCEVEVGDTRVGILLYDDDMVLTAPDDKRL